MQGHKQFNASSSDDYYDQPTNTNQTLGPATKKVYSSNTYYGFRMLYAGYVALENSKSRYGGTNPTLIDGIGDAYRHGYWMALGTRDTTSDYAKRFGDAWEQDHPGSDLQNQMDQHNNWVGRTIGNSGGDIDIAIAKNLDAGTFVYIKNGKLVPTNQ